MPCISNKKGPTCGEATPLPPFMIDHDIKYI